MRIAGDVCAKMWKDKLKKQIEKCDRAPSLAVVLVGDNPASQSYVRSKAKACESVGMANQTIHLSANTSQLELLDVIKRLNEDDQVDGILVQLPLPKYLDEQLTIESIAPEKDVDGLHPINLGKLVAGDSTGFIPCTPKGIIELLRFAQISLTGKHCVVVGRSNLVGKPVSLLLQKENATVTMAHSKTENLRELCQQADVLVTAIGVPMKFDGNWVKPGAIVIDVGINRLGTGRLVGDVNTKAVESIVAAVTPVPGGVGPMTVAMLLDNTYLAYQRKCHG